MDTKSGGFIKTGGLSNKFKNCIEIIPGRHSHKEHEHKGRAYMTHTAVQAGHLTISAIQQMH